VLPNLKATMQGKNVLLLTFEDDTGGAIQKACNHDDDKQFQCYAFGASSKDYKKEMFQLEYSFNTTILIKGALYSYRKS